MLSWKVYKFQELNQKIINQTLRKLIQINHLKAFYFTASSRGRHGKPKKYLSQFLILKFFLLYPLNYSNNIDYLFECLETNFESSKNYKL